jgi:hypothetical protein
MYAAAAFVAGGGSGAACGPQAGWTMWTGVTTREGGAFL